MNYLVGRTKGIMELAVLSVYRSIKRKTNVTRITKTVRAVGTSWVTFLRYCILLYVNFAVLKHIDPISDKWGGEALRIVLLAIEIDSFFNWCENSRSNLKFIRDYIRSKG